jgi:Ca2+-binding RTX toxin-like protein
LILHSSHAANTGNDVLYGNTGNDRLVGNAGGDQMLGGDGFHRFFWVLAREAIAGSSEFDAVFFNRAATELTFIAKADDLITAQFETESIYITNVEVLQFTDQTLFV